MISILECSPNPNDATAYYRTRGVLSFLKKEYSDVTFSYLKNYHYASWSDLIPFDIVLIQRPTTKLDYDFIVKCQQLNKVVWVDYDDLHTAIPVTNPVYHVNPDGGKWMIECVGVASFVTCSTDGIKRVCEQVNKHSYVIKNAHNDYVYPLNFIQKNGVSKRPRVIWRGGVTHESDLFAYKERLKRVIEKHNFKIFGNVSAYTQRDLGLTPDNIVRGMPLEEYLNYVVQYNPAFLIYPLENNEFNKAKSNISALEVLYSGGICIVPEGFEEFKDTAILSSDFEDIIEALSDAEKFNQVRSKHLQAMFKNQVLSVTNADRYKLIKHYTDNR